MTKFATKNVDIWVGGYELEGFTTEAHAADMAAALDDTVTSDPAESVMDGNKSGPFSWQGFFDDAAGGSDAALNALLQSINVAAIVLNTTRGVRAAAGQFLQLDYKTPVQLNGIIMAALKGKVDGGMDMGQLLTPKRTDVANANDTSLDNAASSANGLTAYLVIFASNGTATITVQESSDNGGADPFAAKITFAAIVSGRSSQKLTATGTIERYLRGSIALGTATSVTWAVIIKRG